MQENLVGYLLKALDSATQREVEEYLRSHPEAKQQLDLLRRALAPLAEDKAQTELPPPGLRYATLAKVAEYRCRDLPYAPSPPPSRATLPIRPRWRWPDALVAAAILLIVVSLVPLVRSRLLYEQNLLACKNNLRQLHAALFIYANHHGGRLPMVGQEPPLHIAGGFVPILNEQNLLSKEITIMCPSNGRRAPLPQRIDELRALYEERRNEFNELAKSLGGCYAYCLGYREDGQLRGLYKDVSGGESDRLPIMADRPPFDQYTIPRPHREANSRNHAGRGQNVLFLGGDVHFVTVPTVGINGDHIYFNEDGEVDAGKKRHDTVLGASCVEVGPRRFAPQGLLVP